jgi:hypothetical protein
MMGAIFYFYLFLLRWVHKFLNEQPLSSFRCSSLQAPSTQWPVGSSLPILAWCPHFLDYLGLDSRHLRSSLLCYRFPELGLEVFAKIIIVYNYLSKFK